MKVYSAPEHIKYVIDYSNYDFELERKRETEYIESVKAWGKANGYSGKLTGELVYFPVADGHAVYMYMDNGRSSCLIHIPIGDAWHYPHIQYLPKSEIVGQIARHKKMAALFS